MNETLTIEVPLLPLFDTSSRDAQLRAIATARRALSDCPYDTNLAVFMLRGLPVVEACGLLDLVWGIYRANDATAAEITEILDRLETHLQEATDDTES